MTGNISTGSKPQVTGGEDIGYCPKCGTGGCHTVLFKDNITYTRCVACCFAWSEAKLQQKNE